MMDALMIGILVCLAWHHWRLLSQLEERNQADRAAAAKRAWEIYLRQESERLNAEHRANQPTQ